MIELGLRQALTTKCLILKRGTIDQITAIPRIVIANQIGTFGSEASIEAAQSETESR
jgi:hypothetical protein